MAIYVVNQSKVLNNVRKIENAFERAGVSLVLAYSFKTNSMKPVIDMMENAEVVSYRERMLAMESRCTNVICNGVEMMDEELVRCIKAGDIVNFNDAVTAQNVCQLLTEKEKSFANIGLRVCLGDSRFGIKPDDLNSVIGKLGVKLTCLHCHVSGTRPLHKFRDKIRMMIDAVLMCGQRPRYIDFGGNLYGEMSSSMAEQFDDVCSFDDYAHVIREELNRLDYDPCVILECGTAIIANAVSLMANVIRIDEYNRVVLDCTKYAFGNALHKKLDYIVHGKDKMEIVEEEKEYVVYGCSCLEDDVIIPRLVGRLAVGDVIEFSGCGAYTHCLAPDFIVDRPEVVVI